MGSISHDELVGFYRYSLFATCDVYVAVVHDIEDDEWYYDYSVFARPNTLFEAIDYQTTNYFGIGADAMKLRFDTSIVEFLYDMGKEVVFMNGATIQNTQRVISGSFANMPSVPTQAGREFLGWSIDGKNIVNIGTYQINQSTTFIAVFSNMKTVFSGTAWLKPLNTVTSGSIDLSTICGESVAGKQIVVYVKVDVSVLFLFANQWNTRLNNVPITFDDNVTQTIIGISFTLNNNILLISATSLQGQTWRASITKINVEI